MPSGAWNAFTVDLEDWYHGLTSTNRKPELWPELEGRLVRNTERVLALLSEYDVKATFFVLGKAAEQYPDLVWRIKQAGHEIGVHGYTHRMTHRLTPEEFNTELDKALAVLRPLVEGPIWGHRAPYFSINGNALWALDVLNDKGFRYDSSFFPTRNMLYGYPESPRFPHRLNAAGGLVEFPASTARFLGVTWPIAGGFYIRALPYFIVHGAIRRLNRQGQPAVMYLHPWELDIYQPMRAATLRERVTHYYGRSGLEAKLRQLFRDFRFCPLRDLLNSLRLASEEGVEQRESSK